MIVLDTMHSRWIICVAMAAVGPLAFGVRLVGAEKRKKVHPV